MITDSDAPQGGVVRTEKMDRQELAAEAVAIGRERECEPDENPAVANLDRAAARPTARVLMWPGVTLSTKKDINSRFQRVGEHVGEAVSAAIGKAVGLDFLRKDDRIAADDLNNIRHAVSRLGLSVEYDEFSHQVLIGGKAADDLAVNTLWVRINDMFGFRPSKENLRTVLEVDARDGSFHPVRDYLQGLRWDGVPRLDSWLVTYGGAEDSPFVRAVGRLPLIAAVRRVRVPGSKFDELLILESAQGTGKSTALRTLCPRDEWFSDDLPLGAGAKEVIERTACKWIIEAAEMCGNSRRESDQLKAFLSRQVDGPVRLAYARLATTVPRQFVMIGTTNSRVGYLKDATGARRFWPVTVHAFDIPALKRDRDQIWAEAAAREARGESTRLATDLWSAAGEQQEQRRAADPWEEVLEPLLSNQDAVPTKAIWQALGIAANYQDNRHATRVAAIMERHGFTKKEKRRLNGTPPALYWIREPSILGNVSSE